MKKFHPPGYEDVEIIQQRVVDGKLYGIGRDGSPVTLPIEDVMDVVTE